MKEQYGSPPALCHVTESIREWEEEDTTKGYAYSLHDMHPRGIHPLTYSGELWGMASGFAVADPTCDVETRNHPQHGSPGICTEIPLLRAVVSYATSPRAP